MLGKYWVGEFSWWDKSPIVELERWIARHWLNCSGDGHRAPFIVLDEDGEMELLPMDSEESPDWQAKTEPSSPPPDTLTPLVEAMTTFVDPSPPVETPSCDPAPDPGDYSGGGGDSGGGGSSDSF